MVRNWIRGGIYLRSNRSRMVKDPAPENFWRSARWVAEQNDSLMGRRKLVARTRNLDIPSPQERLCLEHNLPISPSKWKKGHRTSECSKCDGDRRNSDSRRAEREKVWRGALIPCSFHPTRRCQLATYRNTRKRRCSSCITKRHDGSRKPGYLRQQRQNAVRNQFRQDPLAFVKRKMNQYSTRIKGAASGRL